MSQCTDQQIAFTLHQAETGIAVGEVCRKMGISKQTFTAGKNDTANLCFYTNMFSLVLQ